MQEVVDAFLGEGTVRKDVSQDGKVFAVLSDEKMEQQELKPPVFSRVYVHLVGRLLDGTEFVRLDHEEFDCILGQAYLPTCVEMTLSGMCVGQSARVVALDGAYGYSRSRRPAVVPKDWDALLFEVTLLRFEEEKNLQEMSKEEMFDFCARKQALGKQLFAEKKYETAVRVYEKALLVVQGGLGQEAGQSNVQGKKSRLPTTDCKLTMSGSESHRAADVAVTHLLNCAACKMKLEDWVGVVDFCSRVLDIDRVNVKALFRRAVAYRHRDELDSALLDLDRIETDESKLLVQVKRERALVHRAEKQLLKEQARAFKGVFAQSDVVSEVKGGVRKRAPRLYAEKKEVSVAPVKSTPSSNGPEFPAILWEAVRETAVEIVQGVLVCVHALRRLCGKTTKNSAQNVKN